MVGLLAAVAVKSVLIVEAHSNLKKHPPTSAMPK
jgi:hypothetical protein